jgi:hypothetical protein
VSNYKTRYGFKYLPAMLSANEGNIIHTVINKSWCNLWFNNVGLFPSGPPAKINKIPITPKAIDE